MAESGYETAVSLEGGAFSDTLAIMGRVYPSQKLGAQIGGSDVDFAVTWQPGAHVLTLTRSGSTLYADVDGVQVYSASVSTSTITANRVKLFAKTNSNLDTASSGYAPFVGAWNRALTPAQRAKLTPVGIWGVFAKRPKRVFVTAGGGGAYSLTCSAGSYALTGQSVGLLASRTLAAGHGSYALTGQTVSLLRLFTLTAAQGAYALSGQAVALAVSRMLSAGQGSYTLTGQAVSLLASRVLAAEQGSYALTGQTVGFTYTPLGSYNLLADAGSYALTGQAVGLLASRVLAAEAGSYSLSGQAVGLTYSPAGASYSLTVEQGSYALTGQDIAFARTYVLTAAAGSYTLTGRAVTLSYSGAPAASVQDMLRTARGVARLAARGAARNTIRGYRPS